MSRLRIRLFISLGLIFLFIIVNVLLFNHKNYSYKSIQKTDPLTTVKLSQLKDLFSQKMDYIKDNATVFQPYDSQQFSILEEKLNGSDLTLDVLGQLNMITPLSNFGYEPITKQAGPPISTTCLQFNQGTSGWYWLYGTFINEDGALSSYMFYILRMDLAPTEVLRKNKLRPGEASLYYISSGVGINGEWKFSPYMYVRGTYECLSESTFAFKAIDVPHNGAVKMSSLEPMNYNLSVKWQDPQSNKQFGFDVNMVSNKPPEFNSKDGCAPCIGGEGTLYWAYTDLHINGNLTFDSNTIKAEKGVGWMDHQWGFSYLKPLYLQLMYNIQRLASEKKYLGRYLWMNIHLPDKEFLIYTFPESTIKKSDVYDKVGVNIYSDNKETQYDLEGKLHVLETTTVDNVDYPVKYKFQIGNETYIIDSKPFGENVTLDPSGNLHWSGSALLYDGEEKKMGSAFIEANQLQDPTDFLRVQFKYADLDEKHLPLFDTKSLSFSDVLPSFAFILFYISVFIAVILSLCRLIKEFKKSRSH